jgi:hypothetical protein
VQGGLLGGNIPSLLHIGTHGGGWGLASGGGSGGGAQVKAGRKFKVEIIKSIGSQTSSPILMLSGKQLVEREPKTNNNRQICSA